MELYVYLSPLDIEKFAKGIRVVARSEGQKKHRDICVGLDYSKIHCSYHASIDGSLEIRRK